MHIHIPVARISGPVSVRRPRQGRVILKMSVQIPDGRKGTIHVFPGDNPKDLASQFCKKYELRDPKLQRLVERHITESMRNLPQVRPMHTSSSVQRSTAHLLKCPALQLCHINVLVLSDKQAEEQGRRVDAATAQE